MHPSLAGGAKKQHPKGSAAFRILFQNFFLIVHCNQDQRNYDQDGSGHNIAINTGANNINLVKCIDKAMEQNAQPGAGSDSFDSRKSKAESQNSDGKGHNIEALLGGCLNVKQGQMPHKPNYSNYESGYDKVTLLFQFGLHNMPPAGFFQSTAEQHYGNNENDQIQRISVFVSGNKALGQNEQYTQYDYHDVHKNAVLEVKDICKPLFEALLTDDKRSDRGRPAT